MYLLSIPRRAIIERVIVSTKNQLRGERGSFRRGMGCDDKVLSVKVIAEKYLEKINKVSAFSHNGNH